MKTPLLWALGLLSLCMPWTFVDASKQNSPLVFELVRCSPKRPTPNAPAFVVVEKRTRMSPRIGHMLISPTWHTQYFLEKRTPKGRKPIRLKIGYPRFFPNNTVLLSQDWGDDDFAFLYSHGRHFAVIDIHHSKKPRMNTTGPIKNYRCKRFDDPKPL